MLTTAARDGDAAETAFLKAELARHLVALPGLGGSGVTPVAEKETPIVLPKADPKNPDQIGNLPYEVAVKRTLQTRGDAGRGLALFKSQSCVARSE